MLFCFSHKIKQIFFVLCGKNIHYMVNAYFLWNFLCILVISEDFQAKHAKFKQWDPQVEISESCREAELYR